MADLFTLAELATYMQVDSLPEASATLARELATAQIRAAVGPARFDALTDTTLLKPLALEVARRSLLNPTGLRSEQIDDYSVTYASETVAGGLLAAELEWLRRLLGGRASFEIRPAGV